MSENTTRKTLVGTAAPATPPRATPAPGEPAPNPRTGALPAVMPAGSMPTIELRPRRGPPAGDTGGGGGRDPFIGEELCGYLIRRKLAEGGMGEVYEGVHRKIGRLGAIKILRPELCRSDDMVERFYQEARAVNAIRNEHIVDIHDFGRDPSGRVFFVMEYLEGEPLSARIRRGPLGWSEAFPILDQTLRALKAAHDKGFVHRDLKPDNIWLERVDGGVQVKLLDFGIAKLIGADGAAGTMTRTGSVTGTAPYMSPEQINGSRDLDQRTDIYAMGVIIHEMFTGVTPFAGETLEAVLAGHLFRDPPRLDDLPAALGVPELLAEVVEQMLVKDPAGRYRSAADVLADLRDLDASHRAARPAGVVRRPSRLPPAQIVAAAPPRRRLRAIVLGALGAGALVGAALEAWPWHRRSATEQVAVPDPEHRPDRQPAPATPPVPQVLDQDEIRERAYGALQLALARREPAVRRDGADALGKIKDPATEPLLIGVSEHDLDRDVRGHAADALGAIGAAAASTAPPGGLRPRPAGPAAAASGDLVGVLARLDEGAPPPLKVWYASALARLGVATAVARLLAYAHHDDPAVSFKAVLTLAEIARPGDAKVIAALRAILGREVELDRLEPHAAIRILTRMAALRDPDARKRLYAMVEDADEGTRLAAASGLAALGDDRGRKVLQDVAADPASPNRLDAAVAQIALGAYGGIDLIMARRDDPDPGSRRLAARGLGEIGEPRSLPALIPLMNDRDWTVRIAAAAAVVAIVGLDPQALARVSTDWVGTSLGSADQALRSQAARVLPDIPPGAAMPLLARAIADGDPEVRREASRSAGRMKTVAAAEQLARRVEREADPGVKEQQIRSLGAIGGIGAAVAHDALARLAGVPGRLGVIAAGSLIAVGDSSGTARLDAAIKAPADELRLAAVQAAAAAGNPIVVPTLKTGALDRRSEIRFAAALGLAVFRAEHALAVGVLRAALGSTAPGSSDAAQIGQAMAALIRFGEVIADRTALLASLLDSDDPARRIAALPVACELPAGDEAPLLRRLVADLDPDVRRAGVAAIEDLATKDKEEAIRLYKPLVGATDQVVRAKASGQLSRLLPPPPRITIDVSLPAPGAPWPAPPPAAAPPAVSPAIQRPEAGSAAAAAPVQTLAAPAPEPALPRPPPSAPPGSPDPNPVAPSAVSAPPPDLTPAAPPPKPAPAGASPSSAPTGPPPEPQPTASQPTAPQPTAPQPTASPPSSSPPDGSAAAISLPDAQAAAAAPALDARLPRVRQALDDVIAASKEATAATTAVDALATEIAATTSAPAADDAAIRHVEDLATRLDQTAAGLEATAAKAEAGADAASGAAGASPSSDAAPLVAQARALARGVRTAAITARSKAVDGRDKARSYVSAETGSPQLYIARADEEITAGKLDDAKQALDRATALIHASGATNASLDFSYARLYDQMAKRPQDLAKRRALWKQAKDRYEQFARAGTGPRVQQAKQRAAALADQLKQPGPP